MPTRESHPDWCVAVDCERTGIHESRSATAGDHTDIVGVAATRIRLDVGHDAVRVVFTDEDATTSYALPAPQARALTETIDRLLSA